VIVRGHFRLEESYALLSALLAQVTQTQAGALALLHRRVVLHVWQAEGALAIATVGCTQKREQGRVLADGQELTIAERPALGSKVKRENPDLSYKLV
jgi:hypothetical protein